MPTKDEFERMNLTDLAVLCGKLAENPSADSLTAERARGLKQEWALLIAQETPSHPALEEQKKIDAQKELLKKRMTDFLAALKGKVGGNPVSLAE